MKIYELHNDFADVHNNLLRIMLYCNRDVRGGEGKKFMLMTTVIDKDDVSKILSLNPSRPQGNYIHTIIDTFLTRRIGEIHDAWFKRRGWALKSRHHRSVHRLAWVNLSEGATGDGCDIEHADWKENAFHRHIIMEVPEGFTFDEFSLLIEDAMKVGPSWLKNVTVRPATNSIFASFQMIQELREPVAHGEISLPPLNSELYLDDEPYGRNRIFGLRDELYARERRAKGVIASHHV
jgi:hypothetical protein